jgi:dihydroxyacid dehydratase/phosphogluconate dehydratase
MVVVIRFVGPKAAGIPEMLTPTSQIKAKWLKVALISDGRFSWGSYGSVVWHISPEAAEGWPIAKLQSGDIIEIDSDKGTINVNGVDLDTREAVEFNDKRNAQHHGRRYRSLISSAEDGADYVAS